jgi:hypothetical protein
MICNILYINDINNHQRLKNSEQLYGIYDDNDNNNNNDIKIDL